MIWFTFLLTLDRNLVEFVFERFELDLNIIDETMVMTMQTVKRIRHLIFSRLQLKLYYKGPYCG